MTRCGRCLDGTILRDGVCIACGHEPALEAERLASEALLAASSRPALMAYDTPSRSRAQRMRDNQDRYRARVRNRQLELGL